VVGRPPLLLRTQVLRKVASLSLDILDCLLAVAWSSSDGVIVV
jgi:hypothetical protein